MQRRRTLLKLGLAGLAAAPWPALRAEIRPRAAAAAAAPLPRPVPAGRGVYLVDGWLLGEADLRRLGLEARAPAGGGAQAASSG
jgi:hypothetical protein